MTEVQELPPAPTKAARRTTGCAWGCLSLIAVFVAVIAVQLPPLNAPSRAHASIRPGMSPAEVLEKAGHYTFCEIASKSQEGTSGHLRVFGTTLTDDDARQEFASVAELGHAVEERMKQKGGPWAVGFGYITLIPRRTYFRVEFGPDARVVSVSGTWGGLD